MLINRPLRKLKQMDWLLTLAMVLLAVGSVAFIYSASYRGPGQAMPDYYRMQIGWFGIGLVLYIMAAVIDYRQICQWATVWYVLALVLLLVVLFAGAKVYGARRWLGWGGFGIQPSEVAKLAVLIAIAYYLFHRTPAMTRTWATIGGALAIGVVPLMLIFAQPDLGSVVILVMVTLVMLFVAGVRVRHLLLLALAGLLALPLVWLRMKEYQKLRLTVFLDPSRDPLNAGWNLNQSLIAVGSGGLTGKGYLQGTQNLLGYLPRTVAPNDFLFSVIAEEKGFAGSVCVIGLFAVVLFRGLRIATEARDRLGMLLATGIVALLFFHVFVNIGMTIGLLPVKGLPLPLLSYGGSFVLATMTALGLLQNVWIHRKNY